MQGTLPSAHALAAQKKIHLGTTHWKQATQRCPRGRGGRKGCSRELTHVMTRVMAHFPMIPDSLSPPPCPGGTAGTGDTGDTRATHPSTRSIARRLCDTAQPSPPTHLQVMVAQVTQVTQMPLILVREPLHGGPVTWHSPSPLPAPLLHGWVSSKSGTKAARCC